MAAPCSASPEARGTDVLPKQSGCACHVTRAGMTSRPLAWLHLKTRCATAPSGIDTSRDRPRSSVRYRRQALERVLDEDTDRTRALPSDMLDRDADTRRNLGGNRKTR